MKDTYKEVQRVDSLWPLLLLSVTLILNWVLYFGLEENNLDYFFVSVSTSMILSGLLVLTRLSTLIDTKGISYRLFPLQLKFKTIHWQEIETVDIKTYKPIQEFGGWGLRWGRNGKSYSVTGNEGIQLLLKNKNRILIGTQHAKKVKEVILTHSA